MEIPIMFRHAGAVLAAGISLATAAAADGQGFGPPQQVAALTNASAVAYPPGDRARLFVLTLSGMVRVIENGALAPTACLDATAAVGNSANGATGLCFDPEYTTNRYFYIFHSAPLGRVVLARYQMSATDPALADPTSRLVLLQRPGVSQHTGGWIDFGKDGYLYLSGGDLWQDTNGSPQSVTTWTGKFFRLDVRGDDFPDDAARNYAIPPGNPFAGLHPGLDEIWATGIRNAYRCSFDRLTGDLWIADVGGGLREEVNRQPANSTGGENYGWPCWEGNQFRSNCGPASMFTFPILDLEGVPLVVGS
ncbi:MAG: PQQ-dependent sugar dehydrogenase [Phycisphaerales bacterium]|nr:PQQ-dependent sugar dehydrogenase [Phycisphaerales bacterium]